jgi:hypothetical protein
LIVPVLDQLIFVGLVALAVALTRLALTGLARWPVGGWEATSGPGC